MDQDPSIHKAVTEALHAYTAAFQRQMTNGWPDKIRLPAPRTEAERAALRLFLSLVERETRVPVIVTDD